MTVPFSWHKTVITSSWMLLEQLVGLLGKEGNVYLTKHTTHFIYGYMALDTWFKKPMEIAGDYLLLPLHGLLFWINSKGFFICTIPRTG